MKVTHPECMDALTRPSTPTHSSDGDTHDESPAAKKSPANPCKYKTEMCKNYSEMGYCPYWEKCQFAHGIEELHWKEPSKKHFYRTRKCQPFWAKSNCNYGSRCQFSHY